MSLIWFPRRLNLYRRHIRNGLYPASNMWLTAIDAENHLTAYRHREVYRRTWELGVEEGQSGGPNTLVRFRFRTGYGVTKIAYVVLMGIDNDSGGISGGSAQNPYIEIETLDPATPASSTSQLYYGSALDAPVGTDGPDELSAQRVVHDVDPATVYEVTIDGYDFVRPLAICAYELGATTVDESTDYHNTHSPAAGSPIYDADRERLLVGLSNMYRQNGGIVWHWGQSTGAARTRSSATYINAIDDSETGTPTTASRGVYLNPTYHNTESRTTVPFELAAYGSIGGGSGTVRLIDTAGNTYGPVTINSTAGWYTTTIGLPASEAFYAIQYAGDGSNTLNLSFVSLIEWEA